MALKGAQIIFSSSEGDGREGGYTQDIVARARAVNNGVYVVAAGRCMENTGQPHWWRGDGTFIVSPEGYILASSGKQSTEVITREIDLGRSMLGAVTYAGVEAWSDVWREARRPHLYNYLSKY